MHRPLVSIILPFRNAQHTLEECLDSIAHQTFRDFELLAIDDDSRDASRQLIAQRAARDGRIHVISNPRPGLVNALNLGLELAQGDLVARMDADDVMMADRLALQHSFLGSHPCIDLVASQVRLFPDNLASTGYREYLRWQNACTEPQQIASYIYLESPFAHPSVLYRRHRVCSLGGYRDGLFPEDYDLWLRMHQAGSQMAKIPRTLLHWRDSEQRVSRTDPRCSRSAFDRLRAEYLAQDPRVTGDRPVAFWGAGRKTRQRARHLLDRGTEPCAWIDVDCNKIGNRINGIPVVAPDWLARAPKPFVLSYVANHGAREEISAFLAAAGYQASRDFLPVG